MNRVDSLPPISQSPSYQNIQSSNNMNYNNNNNISNLYNKYLSQRSVSANEPSNSTLMNEIKSIKQILKTQFENQNELQSKIIDYNKIISQQENIIRLNNIKLSEHDTKLTDILMSFSNFLKYQEKTNNILNTCQDSINNTLATKQELNEFKNFTVGFKQNLEEQIKGIYHFKSDLLLKLTEIREENKNYQQYSINKIKEIQSQTENNLLKFQDDNMKTFQNQKDNLTAQAAQLKGLVQLVEINLNEETKSRKFALEKVYSDIKLTTDKIDTKFATFEKNSLETEKNLVSLSKDYLSGFQELINKQKEGFATEIKSLKSLVEAGLVRVKNEFQLNLNTIQDNITTLQSQLNEQKIGMDELDVYLKDNIKEINDKTDRTDKNTKEAKKVVDSISSAYDSIMKKTNELISASLTQFSKTYSEKLDDHINKLRVEYNIKNDQNEKRINDLSEQADSIKKVLNEYNKPVSNQGIEENEKRKIEEKLSSLSNDIYDIENKLKTYIKNDNEETKDAFNQKLSKLTTSIGDILNKKIEIAMSDMKANLEKYDKVTEGKIQSSLVEGENRLMERYDQEIIQIKEAIEKLILQQTNENNMNNINNSINRNIK